MQLRETGVTFGSTDFVALAQAYGGYGEWVSESTQLKEALIRAENRTGFTILACKIDKNGYHGAF